MAENNLNEFGDSPVEAPVSVTPKVNEFGDSPVSDTEVSDKVKPANVNEFGDVAVSDTPTRGEPNSVKSKVPEPTGQKGVDNGVGRFQNLVAQGITSFAKSIDRSVEGVAEAGSKVLGGVGLERASNALGDIANLTGDLASKQERIQQGSDEQSFPALGEYNARANPSMENDTSTGIARGVGTVGSFLLGGNVKSTALAVKLAPMAIQAASAAYAETPGSEQDKLIAAGKASLMLPVFMGSGMVAAKVVEKFLPEAPAAAKFIASLVAGTTANVATRAATGGEIISDNAAQTAEGLTSDILFGAHGAYEGVFSPNAKARTEALSKLRDHIVGMGTPVDSPQYPVVRDELISQIKEYSKASNLVRDQNPGLDPNTPEFAQKLTAELDKIQRVKLIKAQAEKVVVENAVNINQAAGGTVPLMAAAIAQKNLAELDLNKISSYSDEELAGQLNRLGPNEDSQRQLLQEEVDTRRQKMEAAHAQNAANTEPTSTVEANFDRPLSEFTNDELPRAITVVQAEPKSPETDKMLSELQGELDKRNTENAPQEVAPPAESTPQDTQQVETTAPQVAEQATPEVAPQDTPQVSEPTPAESATPERKQLDATKFVGGLSEVYGHENMTEQEMHALDSAPASRPDLAVKKLFKLDPKWYVKYGYDSVKYDANGETKVDTNEVSRQSPGVTPEVKPASEPVLAGETSPAPTEQTQTTPEETLKAIGETHSNPFFALLARTLSRTGVFSNIDFVTHDDPNITWAGKYTAPVDGGRGKLEINMGAAHPNGDFTQTLLHEGFHGALLSALNADPATLTAEQIKAKDSLLSLMAKTGENLLGPDWQAKMEQYAKEGKFNDPEIRKIYGLSHIDEFVSEVMTNPDFQRSLHELQVEKQSGFKRFVNSALELIGLKEKPGSAFETAAMKVFDLLDTVSTSAMTTESTTTTPESRLSPATGKPTALQKGIKGLDPEIQKHFDDLEYTKLSHKEVIDWARNWFNHQIEVNPSLVSAEQQILNGTVAQGWTDARREIAYTMLVKEYSDRAVQARAENNFEQAQVYTDKARILNHEIINGAHAGQMLGLQKAKNFILNPDMAMDEARNAVETEQLKGMPAEVKVLFRRVQAAIADANRTGLSGTAIEGALQRLEKEFENIKKASAAPGEDKSIIKALRDAGITIPDLVKEHWIERQGKLASFTEKLITEGGLSKNQALLLGAKVERVVNAAMDAHRKEALAKLAQEVTKPKERLALSQTQKILQASNAGLLTEKAFYNAVAEKFGLPEFTQEFAKKIDRYAQAMQQVPKDQLMKRNQIIQEMYNEIRTHAGITNMDLMEAYWYASVLSGLGTQTANLSGGFFQNASTFGSVALDQAIFKKNPTAAINMTRAIISMMANSIPEVRATLGGDTSSKIRNEINQAQNALELTPENAGRFRKALSKFKYVSRVMSAADIFNAYVAKGVRFGHLASMSPEMKAKLEPYLYPSNADKNAAVNTAKSDGYLVDNQAPAATRKKQLLDQQRRVNEILAAKIPDEYTEAANAALTETYNNKPSSDTLFGRLGNVIASEIGKMRNSDSRSMRMTGTALKYTVFPFTQIAANLADRNLDYFPTSFLTRNSVEKLSKIYGRQATQADLEVHQAKSRMGLALTLSLIASLMSRKEDDDHFIEINGNGPRDYNQKKQWLSAGNKPYTMRIGNFEFSYMNTPLMFTLGPMGALSDRFKYSNLSSKGVDSVMAAYLQGTLGVYGDSTFLSQIKGLTDLMDQRSGEDTLARKFTKLVTRPFTGLSPRIAQDIENLFNPERPDLSSVDSNGADSIVAAVASNLPVVRNTGLSGKPNLNMWGEPVDYRFNFLERVINTRESDPLMQKVIALQNRNIFFPTPTIATLVQDGEGKRSKMSESQFYDYKQAYQQKLKEIASDNVDRLLEMTPEAAHKEIQRLVKPAKRAGQEAIR